MSGRDIHKYHRRVDSALKRIKESNMREKNKKDILEFYEFLIAEGMSIGRIAKYLNHLYKMDGWLDLVFRKTKKKDIIRLVRILEKQDYTPHTKHDYKVVFKRFFKWLRDSEEYPEEVRWLKTTIKRDDSTIPEELLTQDDVEKMINEAHHPRNKALISLLYESGCRVGEVLSLKVKHVSFDDHGAKVVVKGKTGMRKIRLIACIPYLSTWIENHPKGDNPDASLWPIVGTRNNGGDIQYSNIRKLLQKVAKRAGIKKRVNPHIFRHSRATYLANHLTEAQMNQYFGWVQGSDMPSTYVHLSGRDIDAPILKLNGIKVEKEEEQKEKIAPKKCKRCDTMNPSTGKFCKRCGSALDIETMLKMDEKRKRMDDMMSILMKDPETQRFMLNKMREMRMEALATS